MQNQTISKIYTDDNKPKHSKNPTDILKSATKLYEELYTKETTSKTTTTEFISKIPNRKIPNFQVMMAYQQNFMNIFQIN